MADDEHRKHIGDASEHADAPVSGDGMASGPDTGNVPTVPFGDEIARAGLVDVGDVPEVMAGGVGTMPDGEDVSTVPFADEIARGTIEDLGDVPEAMATAAGAIPGGEDVPTVPFGDEIARATLDEVGDAQAVLGQSDLEATRAAGVVPSPSLPGGVAAGAVPVVEDEGQTIIVDEAGVPLLVERPSEGATGAPAGAGFENHGERVAAGLLGDTLAPPAYADEMPGERMTADEQDALIRTARSRAALLWEARDMPRRDRHIGLWAFASLAMLVALLSLALNAILIQSLTSRRDTLQDIIDEASAQIDGAASEGIALDFTVKQTIHFEGDIPVKQDFDFPVNTTIDVNTTVNVPVDLGLGTIMVSVPINTSVPVDTAVPVHVDQTIHIATDIPIEMTVPIRIRPDEAPLKGLIEGARNYLARLQDLL